MGTVVPVFGIEINTNLFEAQIPKNKLQQAQNATSNALSKESLTLHEVQSLTDFLSFCAQAVCLGWVFMRKLWDFVALFSPQSLKFTKKRIPIEVHTEI